MLSHEEGGSSPQINTFFNFMPSRMSPHEGGRCFLGLVEEKEDIHAKAHEEGEVLVAGISSAKVNVSLENDSVGPPLRSFNYQPYSSPEEGSSRQLSREQMTEYAGGCHVFYDPIAEYMERMGNGNDWSHLCCKD